MHRRPGALYFCHTFAVCRCPGELSPARGSVGCALMGRESSARRRKPRSSQGGGGQAPNMRRLLPTWMGVRPNGSAPGKVPDQFARTDASSGQVALDRRPRKADSRSWKARSVRSGPACHRPLARVPEEAPIAARRPANRYRPVRGIGRRPSCAPARAGGRCWPNCGYRITGPAKRPWPA